MQSLTFLICKMTMHSLTSMLPSTFLRVFCRLFVVERSHRTREMTFFQKTLGKGERERCLQLQVQSQPCYRVCKSMETKEGLQREEKNEFGSCVLLLQRRTYIYIYIGNSRRATGSCRLHAWETLLMKENKKSNGPTRPYPHVSSLQCWRKSKEMKVNRLYYNLQGD